LNPKEYYIIAMASSTGHPSQVPVIDISGTLPELEVGRALVDAAATYGFVYIKNEGKDIPVEAIDRMFELVRYHPELPRF
jgi:isopenicillin N synthase-like dioxygenase